jgi:hypothetical protein
MKNNYHEPVTGHVSANQFCREVYKQMVAKLRHIGLPHGILTQSAWAVRGAASGGFTLLDGKTHGLRISGRTTEPPGAVGLYLRRKLIPV